MSQSTQNGRLAAQMDDARYCLADLAQRGLRIISVEVGRLPGKPRIKLDAPWPEPGGLMGGEIVTTPKSKRFAADHHHCQVEWEVPA
ncbi:MAG: hypothetical protein RPU42_14460 [Candidatus Sedimenticola sp. (ex Thyasira tokunagai)]